MSDGLAKPLPLMEIIDHAIRCAEGDQNVHKRYFLALDDLRRIKAAIATDAPSDGLLRCPFCGDDNLGHASDCYMALCRLPDLPAPSVMEAAWNRRTPQPVTPAGGEVAAFGWYTEDHDTDKSATTYDPVVAERWRNKGWPVCNLYTHPPVADAALARDAERYRFLRNDALYYAYASSGLRPMPWCAIGMDKRNFRLAEKEDLDAAIDAALNQRGGK